MSLLLLLPFFFLLLTYDDNDVEEEVSNKASISFIRVASPSTMNNASICSLSLLLLYWSLLAVLIRLLSVLPLALASFVVTSFLEEGGEEAAARTAVRKGVRPSELWNECTNCLSKVVAADIFSDVGPLKTGRELEWLLLLVEELLVGKALKLEERFRLPIIF